MTTTRVQINQSITVRGETYRVAEISEDKGHLGPRYFGKRVFTLVRHGDGARFTCFGKNVTANARLTPKEN